MSTEEKARAYDEALKQARFYHENWPSELEKKKLEEMFPVLRESEDEKTRKLLIEFISDIKKISESGRNTWAVRKDDAEMCDAFLTYLEKVKDASKAIEAVDRIDKYIDEKVANAHDMKDSNPDKKYYRGWDDALGKMAGILQDVYSNEKQKEQPISAEEVLARAGLKPYKDGNKWCILAGDNIQEGICGFGDTIDEALYEFLKEVIDLQKEQKSIEDVVKDITKNKESAIKFLKSAGIMNDNGELAEIYRSEQKPISFNESYNPDEYEVVMEGNATSLKRKDQKPVDYEHEMWKNCEVNFEGGKKEVIEHPEKYGLQKAQKPTENNVIIPQFRIGDCIKPKAYNEEHLIKDINKDGYVLDIDFVVPFKYEDIWEVVKPNQEFSKEDERMLERAVHIIVEYSDIDEKESEIVQNWLKDLPERFNLQIKQEWSEEDKMRLAEAIRMVEANGAWIIPRNEVKPISDLLKSLCLQPHWKPSEEQMEALETAERWYSDNMGCNLVLVSLCEQLKKLM